MNSNNSSTTPYRLIGFVAGLLLFNASVAHALDSPCAADYVKISDSNLLVQVLASGQDDSTNIQCALEAAKALGLPTVRLMADTYNISEISVTDFRGTLEGAGMANTIVNLIDGSRTCSQPGERKSFPAAIKFIGGEPRLRYMSVYANKLCIQSGVFSIIHITAATKNDGGCSDRGIVFATIDRVWLKGPDNLAARAITVGPEGSSILSCRDKLLGSFKINRSHIESVSTGLDMWMNGGASVQVTYNTFSGSRTAVRLYNSNVDAFIAHNEFFVPGLPETNDPPSGEWEGYGLAEGRIERDWAPDASVLVVSHNRFHVKVGVAMILNGPESAPLISGNTFYLDQSTALQTWNVSNGHVGDNLFVGPGYNYALLLGSAISTVTDNWAIMNNEFSDYGLQPAVIHFSPHTNNNVVGPGQEAVVEDEGTNIVLE